MKKQKKRSRTTPTYRSRAIDPQLLGENICRARVRVGLSQVKLANTLKTSQGLVARYEAGKVVPTVERLKELAKALSTTIDTLTGR